uniref:Uncharacterized protein n=1 Tax=Rousettus aegyptiacus TaxID=9407 RepID=A0A7J8HS33_ROUAE|nr:hypothetical protein HJG63_010873 [Rousettus aegyptiacus]
MKAWRLWPAGLSPAAGIEGHVLWVADTPRMSGGRVSTGPRLAPRTLRRPLRPLSLLVLRPDVSSCPLPVFLYLLSAMSLFRRVPQPGLLFSLSLRAAPCPASWAAWSVGGGGPFPWHAAGCGLPKAGNPTFRLCLPSA